uniref:Uncharacterized protein LOC108040064 n=1 Tax=Drosophila rhopaloa TaxID=1041015 RepID=A0A6P4E8C9_DRORH
MKPDQLNRLIKVNRRMQPWFLRNTSELYESAIRTYYERANSSHNQFPSLRTENVGPLRRIKKAEPEPSPADVYPRSHILQADQAASSSSGQLLHTMMQASRRRSMSFSAARPYATYGQSTAPRSGASSSCSSGRSSGGSSRTEILGGRAKRKRKSGRGGSKAETLKEDEEELVDMGMLFGGRSMSLPPPLPSAPGLGCGAMMRTMPPSRQHHMAAMAKNSLTQPVRIPRGDGDHLMPVDAALKRRISVLGGQLEEGRGRARAELGHLMVTGNGSSIDGGRFPSEMRFRFQTLGDRIKQFEYIQFADGPVASYAFNRSHRGPSGGGSGSTRSRLESLPRDADVGLQPRHLSFNNVLHANYRQRSRSLEHANQLLEAIAPRPVTPVCPLGNGGSARGSSLDSSSRTSFQPSSSTATETNAENCGKSSGENLGYSKSSKETSVGSFRTAWQGTPARDWYTYQGSSSTLGTTTAEATTVRNSNTYKGNRGSSSGPGSGSIPGAKSRSVKGCTAGETLGSSAVNSAPFRATSGASSKGTKKAASEAASGGFAGPISGSHSGSYSGSYSGSHSGSLSGSYAGQEEP